jgi:hypothetical protein
MEKKERIRILKSIVAQKGKCDGLFCKECRKAVNEPAIFSSRAISALMDKEEACFISGLLIDDGAYKRTFYTLKEVLNFRTTIAQKVLHYLEGNLIIQDEEQIILDQNN